MKSVITEEEDENKSSSIAVTVPSKIHDFSNKLETRLKANDEAEGLRNRYKFEIANESVAKSALDIFKAHYNKIME